MEPPPDLGRTSPSRGNAVSSAPLTLDGHMVLPARELPPSVQPLSPRSSDPEPPSPLHLDYPGSANLQGQATPPTDARVAKPRIAPILTTSPSSSLPATPTLQPLQPPSTAVVTQHLAIHTSNETASKFMPSALIPIPPAGENQRKGSVGPYPASPVNPTPVSATPQMHSASQI